MKKVAPPSTDIMRNYPHFAVDGKFHRVTLHDQGPTAFDRYLVRMNGKLIHFGPHLLAAETTYEACVAALPE